MARYLRRQRRIDVGAAQDMAEAIKKIMPKKRERKRTFAKQADEGEVSRIFEGQRFGDDDIKLGPRNEGWQIIDSKIETSPGGQVIEKTTRIRSFGRLKKLAFIHGFADELEKRGFTIIELLMALGVGGAGGAAVGGFPGAAGALGGMAGGAALGGTVGRPGLGALGGAVGGALLGRKIGQWLKGKKKEQTKKACLEKFAAGFRSAMIVEPTPKKSSALEKNPFLRLEAKRRLVSGRARTGEIPKVRGLLSGSYQFAHLTRRPKEAS